MADRVVYLVGKLPKGASDSKLEFVDDVTLGELLADGWETSTTLPERTMTVGGKSVKATMIILKQAAENRGVAMRHDDPMERRAGGDMVIVKDQFGHDRSLTPGMAVIHQVTQALANIGEAGHLGPSRNHNMPGLSIVSGEISQKAFDMGTLAYQRGDKVEANPFPQGSTAAQRWLNGYRTMERSPRQQVTDAAYAEAKDRGKRDAKEYGEHDVIQSPFPSTSPLHDAWLEGFREGGGRVE